MASKKRGPFSLKVEVFLLLFVLCFLFTIGQPTLNDLQYYTSFVCTDDIEDWGQAGNSCNIDGSVGEDLHHGLLQWFPPGTPLPATCPESDAPMACHDFFAPSYQIPDQGCWFSIGDTAGESRCGWAYILEGTILPRGSPDQAVGFGPNRYVLEVNSAIHQVEMVDEIKIIPSSYLGVIDGGFGIGYHIRNSQERGDSEDDRDGDVMCGMEYHQYQNNGIPKICASDHYWHGCIINGGESKKGTVTWANNILYECSEDDTGQAVWLPKGRDDDHDTYIGRADGGIDCSDSPSSDPSFCSDVETTDDCDNDVKNYQCAKCINPKAPEICGDGVDNDCSDTLDYLPDTSDSCDENQLACEQTTIDLTDAEGNPIDEFGEPIRSEDEKVSKIYNNKKDQPFSWIETSTGGDCCGYAGMADDFARLSTGDTRVCLFNDKNLVGVDATSVQEVKEVLNWAGCEGEWCWVRPSGLSKFKIATIKKPGEPAYDIVSDSGAWHQCTETRLSGNSYDYLSDRSLGSTEETDGDTEPVTDAEQRETVNRFACYTEGKHFSWAECVPKDALANNPTIKKRSAGDGLYTLYLNDAGQSLENPTVIVPDRGKYNTIYQRDSVENLWFDFTYYNHLEFFVQFTSGGTPVSWQDLTMPVDLRLTIYGPKSSDGSYPIYLQKSVLGDAVNYPLFSADPHQWIHIKTEIPENLDTIGKIEIASMRGEDFSNDNDIIVQNVFLSWQSDEGDTTLQNPVCSGEVNSGGPNWLSDFDDGVERGFNAQTMCTARYGDNAWLGSDFDVDNDGVANCCGDDGSEYYAGPVAESTGLTESTRYGCWNSQVIAAGETTMNVGVEVVSGEKTNRIIPRPVEFDIRPYYQTETEGIIYLIISDVSGETYSTSTYSISLDTTPLTLFESGINFVSWAETIVSLGIDTSPESLPLVLSFINLETNEKLGRTIEKDADGNWPAERIGILAELDIEEYASQGFIDIISEGDGASLTTPSFPCSDSECLFPLKGGDVPITTELLPGEVTLPEDFTLPENTLYLLRNPHPDLYELWFVSGSNPDDQTILTGEWQAFTTKGNLLAKRVAQQVVYVNQDDNLATDEDDTAMMFYGCQAPSSIENTPTSVPETSLLSTGYFENLQYCAQKANHFCSPSLRDTAEGLTTINTWSKEDAPQGYDLETTYTLETEDDLDLLADALKLKTEEKILVADRKFAVSAVPGRNLIPDAVFQDFKTGSRSSDLRYWELFDTTNHLSDNEKGEVNFVSDPTTGERTYTFELDAGKTLKSDRIAVPKNTEMHFSQEGTCLDTIDLIDVEGCDDTTEDCPEEATAGGAVGTPVVETEPRALQPAFLLATTSQTFTTGDATSLRITFTGGCTITKPMLQVLDPLDPTPAPFDYISRDSAKTYPRSGIACCKENYCWNGYACIAPMEDSTLIAEHLPDGRNYRCINGAWTDYPLQKDWNEQKVGFCQQESQCFVLSSQRIEDISLSTDAEPIVAGIPDPELHQKNFHDQTTTTSVKFPTCINNGEYILDHSCDAGAWTSRTKFLANTLLQGAADNYALYCTRPQDILPEYAGKEPAIFGAAPGASATVDPLGAATTAGTPATCFPTSLEIKRTLLPDRDNTCINNVCLLKQEGKVILGTTLNKPINSPDSFLGAVDLNTNACDGTEEAIDCETAIGEAEYFPTSNAFIYGKEGIGRDLSVDLVIDTLQDAFASLLGLETDLSEADIFLADHQNFRDLYLLQTDSKSVQAVKEILPKKGNTFPHTILARYENFDTPICQFVNGPLMEKATKDFNVQLLQDMKVSCKQDGSQQVVEINVNEGAANSLTRIWPQLTAKLRPQG